MGNSVDGTVLTVWSALHLNSMQAVAHASGLHSKGQPVYQARAPWAKQSDDGTRGRTSIPQCSAADKGISHPCWCRGARHVPHTVFKMDTGTPNNEANAQRGQTVSSLHKVR